MRISIIGIDGSGKSTQTRFACAWLQDQGVSVEIVDKWHVLDASKLPACRFIHSTREELRLCIAEMEGISRALFLFWSIAASLDEDLMTRNPEVTYLLDGYCTKHAAAEIVYGAPREWIVATTALLPKPDVTIFLDVGIDVAVERKAGLFSPYECGRDMRCGVAAYRQHQSRLREELIDLGSSEDWHVIDASQSAELVHEQVKQVIAHHIRVSVPDGARV